MKKKTAQKKQRKKRVTGPHHWDKVVSAAYQRTLGATQEKAAEAVGVCRRTMYSWERSEFWNRAMDEAHRRWCAGIVANTKNAILEALGDPAEYASMARFVGERMIEELRPAKQTREISGVAGGAIKIDQVSEPRATAEELLRLVEAAELDDDVEVSVHQGQRGTALGAAVAHNHEEAGSTPAPATIEESGNALQEQSAEEEVPRDG
jgi:hypothetical protein